MVSTGMKKLQKIAVIKDGPYMVCGNVPLAKEISVVDEEDNPTTWEKGKKYPDQESYKLCRCGKSGNKPYCDGTHRNINFDGTETASMKKYIEQAEKTTGPDLELTDAENFCASGRFCHRGGGTWGLTEDSSNPAARQMAIQEASNCPPGRLVAWDKKTGKAIEPQFEPSISLIEDPQAKVSGPIWVKGKIQIESAEGTNYEVRNRVTLCRCGESGNKPFCDGSHIKAGFTDENESNAAESVKKTREDKHGA